MEDLFPNNVSLFQFLSLKSTWTVQLKEIKQNEENECNEIRMNEEKLNSNKIVNIKQLSICNHITSFSANSKCFHTN
jgi:hypothetical protein